MTQVQNSAPKLEYYTTAMLRNIPNKYTREMLIKQFHGVDVRQCLPGINSKKVAEVTPARLQGLTENVRRLRNSPVMDQLAEHPDWMPLIFDRNGEPEPFPLP